MLALKPLPGRVLVELRERYEHVATAEQKYDTRTSGICVDIEASTDWLKDFPSEVVEVMVSEMGKLEGKLVFWEEYKDGAVIERDGKKYAFIKIEDLDGYEDVEG